MLDVLQSANEFRVSVLSVQVNGHAGARRDSHERVREAVMQFASELHPVLMEHLSRRSVASELFAGLPSNSGVVAGLDRITGSDSG